LAPVRSERIDDGDIPADDAPDDGKRPSQRLLPSYSFGGVRNTDQSEPFQRFYERWIEKRIQAMKDELS
jgi:hypothetical protein